MSDRLRPLSLERLARLLETGLSDRGGALLGLSRELIFRPDPRDPFRMPLRAGRLDTPVGVAAGPHTQMTQNIVAAWLMGARTIELKTVQARDDIEVPRPCIAVRDEGWNCEWSQELRLEESLRQYVDAWLLVHALARRLGHPDSRPGVAFVMSVGYDLASLLSPGVQGFLAGLEDASARLEEAAREVAPIFPEALRAPAPARVSATVTLSTMHGCPPSEIARMAQYLVEERGLDTLVKLNPTLLGADEVRRVLAAQGCEARVPDEAFEHDLGYDDALRLIETLRASAARRSVRFGLKLTNTLETVNDRGILPESERRIYMSGLPLLPLAVRLAARLQRAFGGGLNISFSAGADAASVADLLACRLAPVTVCTDLLRPGGYGRLRQYLDEIRARIAADGASSLEEWTGTPGAALERLEAYAERLLSGPAGPPAEPRLAFKGSRRLPTFDCVRAPCEETCPAEQGVADYMHHAARGDWRAALAVVLATNPLPRITGTACDALCRHRCTRGACDAALRIRDVKLFASLTPAEPREVREPPERGSGPAVAVVGAGPSGLACAAEIARVGVRVDLFDGQAQAGGLARRVIPRFRLSDADIDSDVQGILALGVRLRTSTTVDRGLFERLARDYSAVYVAAGAQKDKRLGIPGEDAPGVRGALDFLEACRAGSLTRIGPKVAVVGGGNSAVDAARVALRLAGHEGRVSILYRRTVREMPADREELEAALAEGAELRELVSPAVIRPSGGALEVGLQAMELGPPGADGRRTVAASRLPTAVEAFDAVITAVGQDAALDFAGSRPGLLIGGDAARGPASIILAIADGKKAAASILAGLGIAPAPRAGPRPRKHASSGSQLARLARREWPRDDPAAEASRCLGCDEICNLCVSVCPNRANICWESEARTFGLQGAALRDDGSIAIEDLGTWTAAQRVQVLTIADWCNSCGACAAFCPTAGAPYRDKPRLCLSEESFAAQDEAFVLSPGRGGQAAVRMRSGGDEARLAPGREGWRFEARGVRAVLDRRSLAIRSLSLARLRWDTRQAASMAFLAASLGSTELGRRLAAGRS